MEKSKNVLPARAGSTFLKMANSMCTLIAITCKFVKIENVLLARAGSTFLKVPCSSCVFNEFFLKKDENRKCAPRLGRKHNFANFIIEPRSVVNNYFANGSSPLVRNENHENQVGGGRAECAGALGGDLRGV